MYIFFIRDTVKLSNSRTNSIYEFFDYFCVFFCKKFGKNRAELQNELNMMHSSDENIELCSVDRFRSIERNRNFYKKPKNNQKIHKSN
jgi:hypothetical protein